MSDLSPIQRSLRTDRKGLDQSDRTIGHSLAQILIPEIVAATKRRKPFRARCFLSERYIPGRDSGKIIVARSENANTGSDSLEVFSAGGGVKFDIVQRQFAKVEDKWVEANDLEHRGITADRSWSPLSVFVPAKQRDTPSSILKAKVSARCRCRPVVASGVSTCQQPVGADGVTGGHTPAIDGIKMNPLVGETGLTVIIAPPTQSWTLAWLLVPTNFHQPGSLSRSTGE